MNTFYTLIKKYRFAAVLCCMFIPVITVYAEVKSTGESAYGTFSGDYVVYRDYSWKTPTWIGFLYYDDETYGAFLTTPETKTRVALLFSVKPETENTTLNLTGQQIISSIRPEDTFAVNYLMTMLPKLYEQRTFSGKKNALFRSTGKKNVMEEFGGNVKYTFDAYIPLFHLKALHNVKNGIVLELAEMGNINGGSEQIFYEYTPPIPKQGVNQFNHDKKAKKETVFVNDIALHLDSQWTKIADNSFLCGDSAFLTVVTVNAPAQDGNQLSESEQFIKLFASSGSQVKVLLPYTVIKGKPERFTLEQTVYDTESKKINKDIKRCIKNSDGSFTVISLTVDSFAYNAQQKYFNRLF